MTDNQIINALECCVKTEFISDCAKCEMFAFDCKDTLIEEALDLINRQKAEIDRLRKLQKPTEAGGFRIENGKVVFYSDMLNGYRHEYKDIDEIVKELNLYMHTDYKNIELISHYKHKAQTAKSEARKELAERLKKSDEFWDCIRTIGNVDEIDCVVNTIDNLVKEMKEVNENDRA